MTEEQIDSMPAGRQMDMLIAEKVMGWKHYPDDLWERMKDWLTRRREFGWDDRTPDEYKPRMMIDSEGRSAWPPYYSERIENAWIVLEKLEESGIDFALRNRMEGERGRLVRLTKPDGQHASRLKHYVTSAESFSLAICRAALKTTI